MPSESQELMYGKDLNDWVFRVVVSATLTSSCMSTEAMSHDTTRISTQHTVD